MDLLGSDVREMVKGMKLATTELVNNKHNKKLKVINNIVYITYII